MPSLLTFGVCRNAIIDRDSGSVSMFSLVNNFTVALPANQPIAPDSKSPVEWAVVTAWLRHEEDEGKSYEQRHLLIAPDESSTEHDVATFTFDLAADSRILTGVTKAFGFPVGQAGEVILRVELRKVGSAEWVTIAEYPVQITHQIQEGDAIVPT